MLNSPVVRKMQIKTMDLRGFQNVKNFKEQYHQVLAKVWVKVHFYKQLVGLKITMKFFF